MKRSFSDWIVDNMSTNRPWKSKKYRNIAIGEIYENNRLRNKRELQKLSDKEIATIWLNESKEQWKEE